MLVGSRVTLDEFRTGLTAATPPAGLTPPLAALWHTAKGDWDQAHRIVMDEANTDAAWVHAYLHRVEGDLGNAGYWYRQAGRPPADGPLADEWTTIVAVLLGQS